MCLNLESTVLKKKPRFWRNLRIYTFVIAAGLFTGYTARAVVVEPVAIEGSSMYPTLQDGERHFLNKVTEPKRFDIIVFHANAQDDYVKRLIGLPGDTVKMKNDQLYINGKKVNEPYIKESGFVDALKNEYGPIQFTSDFDVKSVTGGKYMKIPKDYYLVLGDNRLRSSDSREIGLIKKSSVVGKLFSYNKDIDKNTKRSKQELREHAVEEIN